MTTLLSPRRGDVILVEQGLGVVRFVGNVDFDEVIYNKANTSSWIVEFFYNVKLYVFHMLFICFP